MRQRNFFEGWYYKIVSPDNRHIMAFIPGISVSKDSSHSFVQVISNRQREAGYIKYPSSSFTKLKGTESVRIGGNLFSTHGIKLDLNSCGLNISGNLMFDNTTAIERNSACPSAMGYFDYIPFMECRHDVLSMGHDLSGELSINDNYVDFTKGRGYIEKDSGRSFPESWVWIHSNSFSEPSLSLMCSVAKVPLLSASITGFICILTWAGRELRFATYNGSHIKEKFVTEDEARFILKNKGYTLSISAKLNKGSVLKAPRMGTMERNITESLSSHVDIVLYDKDGCIILADASDCTGLEISMPGNFALT